jgi:hypothetical protein
MLNHLFVMSSSVSAAELRMYSRINQLQQGFVWEIKSISFSQVIHRISWILKGHNRVHFTGPFTSCSLF